MSRGEKVWSRVTYSAVERAAGCSAAELRRVVRSGRLDMRDLGSVARFVCVRLLCRKSDTVSESGDGGVKPDKSE